MTTTTVNEPEAVPAEAPARWGLEPRSVQRFLNFICLVIGTIMAYRGVIDFFLYKDSPWRALLGIIFFGGVASIYLIHRRRRIGFWLFAFFDFSVGLVFIFALQDVWYHHVWPHIAYAAVFVPFYGHLYWGAPSSEQADLFPPEPVTTFPGWAIGFLIEMVGRRPWIAHLIERIPPVQRWVNRRIVDSITSIPPARPLPYSLWTPAVPPIPRDDTGTPIPGVPYVAWSALVDRAFTGRHLPPVSEDAIKALPKIDEVSALFARKTFQASDKTSALFCFFAQWFTDSFLRSHPEDRRRNTSNHEIDLCQIYGLGQESTRMLREGKGGRLRARLGNPINGRAAPIYPEFLADQTTLEVRKEFAEISFDPIAATTFGDQDPPHGRAGELRKLLKSIGEWTQEDSRWRMHYAAGLERANSTILYSAINTIFLREHNRLADELAKHYKWGDESSADDRLFETARNINIVKLLKVIIEDYINHLASSPFKLRLEQGFADRCGWYRTNRISLEFNLLYRWHAMVPDQFVLNGKPLSDREFRFNNALVEQVGVEALLHQASQQPAGSLGLHNTPTFLLAAEHGSIAFARQFRLAPFNAYRRRWQQPSYPDIDALVGDDKRLGEELKSLYGKDGIERVELPVGLLAEHRAQNQVLPPVLQRMVASDAFSQALTNPLLAANVYGADCFTDFGVAEIEQTHSFADIVGRNVTAGVPPPSVSFSLPDAAPFSPLELSD